MYILLGVLEIIDGMDFSVKDTNSVEYVIQYMSTASIMIIYLL